MKKTAEQKAAIKEERREKRSKFLTRMVDEFKKVGFIAVFFVCVGTIVWSLVLYGMEITPTLSPTIPCAAFALLGTAFAFYCNAVAKEKDSLNKNGLVKDKGGVITKIAETVTPIVKTIINAATPPSTEDEDSDEKEE